MVWFEDDEMSGEVVEMGLVGGEEWGMGVGLRESCKGVMNGEEDGGEWGGIGEGMGVLDDGVEG